MNATAGGTRRHRGVYLLGPCCPQPNDMPAADVLQLVASSV